MTTTYEQALQIANGINKRIKKLYGTNEEFRRICALVFEQDVVYNHSRPDSIRRLSRLQLASNNPAPGVGPKRVKR